MMQFNKVTIIGVGLIGGSIGLAIKKRKLAREVVGVFRHSSTLRRVLAAKAIDKGVMDIGSGTRGADFIIIATPVHSIPSIAKEVLKYAGKGTIITDAGSTKGWITSAVERAISRFPSVFFVGSHPMAGSEHQGVEFARSDLLEGSPCIVTKTAKTDARAMKRVIGFWKALGARVKVVSPSDHDRSVSLISHLPHLVAYSVAGAVPETDLRYAAEGFRDTTRVASSDPQLWADIFLTNRKEVLNACRMFERYYKRMTRALSKNDHAGMARLLKGAKSKRDRLYHGK